MLGNLHRGEIHQEFPAGGVSVQALVAPFLEKGEVLALVARKGG